LLLKTGCAKQRHAGFLRQAILDLIIDLSPAMYEGQLEVPRTVLCVDPTIRHFGIHEMGSRGDKHEMNFRRRANAITMNKNIHALVPLCFESVGGFGGEIRSEETQVDPVLGFETLPAQRVMFAVMLKTNRHTPPVRWLQSYPAIRANPHVVRLHRATSTAINATRVTADPNEMSHAPDRRTALPQSIHALSRQVADGHAHGIGKSLNAQDHMLLSV
jgi:hypothetical protein